MIFRSLAEFGFTSEQVLDFTPRVTVDYLSDIKALDSTDERYEARIRSNLEFYKDKPLLRLKYEKELERHLKKSGDGHKSEDHRMKNWIIDKVSNG